MEKILSSTKNTLIISQLDKHLKICYGRIMPLIKRLALPFCLILLFSAAQAQENTDFYYFGDVKIFMSQSTEKLYVRMEEGATETIKMTLSRDYQLPEKAFETVQSDNAFVINLENLDANKMSRIISDLAKDGYVEASRPVLIAPGGKEAIVDEGFYVKLKQGISNQKLKDFALQKNCILNETPYKYDDKVFFLKAGIANHFDGLKLANIFYESGLCEYAEPDFSVLNPLSTLPPNDPYFHLQWAANNTGSFDQGSGTPGADIKLLDAWDITMGSPLIKIAVLDYGIDRSHPDLINNITPIGFGLEQSNANTGDILNNSHEHGTICAGIIAAEANNGIGIAGVAPNCKLIPVNIRKSSSNSILISELTSAMDWSWDEGEADVLSNSWETGGVASSLIEDAIYRAVKQGRDGKGSVVVFASGNNNSAGISYPAILPETIAVGAMSMCYQRKSPTSCDGNNWGGNYGIGLDISAPGTQIATTGNTGLASDPSLAYIFVDGTSAAAPFVSGVAALILSVNNNLTQLQVREIIESTARKVGPYSYSFVPEQPNGTWTSELGHGMVNAQDAVIAALTFECQNTVMYPESAVAISSGLDTLSECNYFGDYSEISGIVGGVDYEFTVTGNGYITVRTDAIGGSVLASGISPLIITALNSDNLFVHWNTDNLCGTMDECQTTTVQIIWECQSLEANFGDACDDGDSGTDNDTVHEDCNCIGSPSEAILNGSITWNSNCGERDETIKLYEPGTPTEVASYTLSLQNNGTFYIPGIEIGTFDVIVKVEGYLAKGIRNVGIAAGTNNLAVGDLVFGDLNNDNIVDFVDLGTLSGIYLIQFGQTEYNPMADANCDDIIDFVDLGALSGSYLIIGDTAPLQPSGDE